MDQRTIAEAFVFPGSDPRQWVSYGTVDDDDPVTFDPDYGPLVAVTLQPSNKSVHCRVAMPFAGNGEGEYHPFVAGDEVIVLIPEGDERADCAIVGRFTNSIDKFPLESVGGQDPTKNNFGFRRYRTPFVEEAAGPWMIRQATTGALLSIDKNGSLTFRDGAKDVLQMSADVFGFQSADSKFLMQLDLTGGRLTLQVDDALLTMTSSHASPQQSAIAVPGMFKLSAKANPAGEHVLTTEALGNVLAALMTTISTLFTAAIAPLVTPAPGAPLGALISAPLAIALLPTTVAAAMTTAAAAPLNPAIAAAIFAAFSAGAQKPPPVPGSGQLLPGIGSPGFLTG
jgi:hypothetical protein